jgi:Caspase domain
MQKIAPPQLNRAKFAIKTVVYAGLLLCAGTAPLGFAQNKAQNTTDGRNLQVQSALNSSASVNRNQRVALVIGNGAYKDAPLTNPVNDARAISTALQEAGFTVILRENTDQRGMLSAMREFGDKLRSGGTGLFYYAGHGMQIKGRNYLIPVGANVEREDEVAYSAVDAQAVLDKMEAAGNATNIMILDACRNNPFTRSSRSSQGGLAQMDAPVGTLVAFATSPGAVASDGTGANGLYTQHLLTAMRQQGSKVEDVFKQVRANVRRDSQGKQVPWESTSLEGDFYFKSGASATTAAAVDSSNAIENALWDAVKNSNLPIELRAYLNRFPAGRYAAQAKVRLTQLQPAPSITKPVQPQPAAVVPASNEDQSAIDRRTQELLAGLATQSTGAAAGSSPIVPARPINNFGFTVGDRWRYQTVDKFKQEVVSNWTRKIDGIKADSSLRLNDGSVDWSANGDIIAVRGANGYLRQYSPMLKWKPDVLQVGSTEDINTKLTWRDVGGENGIDDYKATLKVVGQERVKVPAGEFEAWKIEMAGYRTGKNLSRNSNYNVRFKEVFWYVPALRGYVATEYEQRTSSGALDFFTRHELTSYSVRGADEALAKR